MDPSESLFAARRCSTMETAKALKAKAFRAILPKTGDFVNEGG